MAAGEVNSGEFRLEIIPGNEFVDFPPGPSLLEVLRKSRSGREMAAPCGGKGTCGKCRVRILSGDCREPGPEEKQSLSEQELKSGMRLACRLFPSGDLTVELQSSGEAAVLVSPVAFGGVVSPLVRKQMILLEERDGKSQLNLFDQVRKVSGIEDMVFSGSAADSLSRLVQLRERRVTLILDGNRVLDIESGDTSAALWSFAVDIGTTSVVVSLVDASSGKEIDRRAGLNRQGIYGADVITRISHAADSVEGLKELQDSITLQIGEMMEDLCIKNGIRPEKVNSCVLAGNTSMLHLFAGVYPLGIAQTPYVPVFTEALHFAEGTGPLGSSPFGKMVTRLVPGRSAYIGADITVGIAAVGMDMQEETALFVDIGTNGEIVLGSRDALVSCATAAGPAFEGAHIACGTGSIAGAVYSVVFEADTGRLKTGCIGGGAPSGICGSGIVDIAALLVREGLVDGKGRFLAVDKLSSSTGDELKSRRTTIDGEEVFLLSPASESAHGSPVYFSQKDLREVQLAKGAVAAGIETLLNCRNMAVTDVEMVYLAGGFGSALDPESAFQIGLLPAELKGRVIPSGNTSQRGAVYYTLSGDFRRRTGKLRESLDYLELSFDKGFSRRLMAHMYFDIPRGI